MKSQNRMPNPAQTGIGVPYAVTPSSVRAKFHKPIFWEENSTKSGQYRMPKVSNSSIAGAVDTERSAM